MGDQFDVVALIRDVFVRRGSDSYLGEEVTMSEHMLQAAALAEAEGADDALVVAALLHDVGHYVDEFSAYSAIDKIDKQHDVVGAELLAPYFDSRVVAAVRLHVAAKRYLCATRPEYSAQLSVASVHSLSLQGGPMSSVEVAEFEKIAGFGDSVRVRMWDDRAKVPRAPTKSFDEYVPLLLRSLRTVN